MSLSLSCLFLSSRLIHWGLILTQGRRVKLAIAEHKTHRSDVDTGGYNALDFALHDSHVPLGRVGIYRILLYMQSL